MSNSKHIRVLALKYWISNSCIVRGCWLFVPKIHKMLSVCHKFCLPPTMDTLSHRRLGKHRT